MKNHAPSHVRFAREASRRKVGDAVRRARTAAGLSLARLSQRVGLTASTISKIENGRQSISFERLERLAFSLGCNTMDLIERGDATSPAVVRCRRSITDVDDAPLAASSTYHRRLLASDLLDKSFSPIVLDVLVDDVRDYGSLSRHDGEEFNFVLEGQLEFHTEIYAPVRLAAGSGIYFDGATKHARIKVGSAPCRVLAIICPGLRKQS